ncbi:MAG: Lrp/AsnC family transcriptional regulator [OCS116 cluster bacterium]|uniref:ArsR family transcriptional regulator n=1 Tax=OCS116 cluster bacterium TaxID=2030921 RepID=A0A2A4YZR4_9PROT|nr:Lrp/AsnC family transcriptional regulator [OCS116 cluster bacterium]
MVAVNLDATDWRILQILQNNGRITNVDLAKMLGISPPPCLRRVRALEQAGMIKGYRTILAEKQLGFDLTVFAMVGLHNQSEADLLAFEALVNSWPLVREAYMLSGEADYILKCVAPDLTVFQNFVIDDLTAAPNVDNVKTSLTIKCSKQESGVPLEFVKPE